MDQQTTSPSRKNELFMLVLVFVLITLILKTVFYQEPLLAIFRITGALFWLFIVPGYFLTRVWKTECSFMERFIICIPISAALLGILSYYLALAGIPLSIQIWLLPLSVLIMTGALHVRTH